MDIGVLLTPKQGKATPRTAFIDKLSPPSPFGINYLAHVGNQ